MGDARVQMTFGSQAAVEETRHHVAEALTLNFAAHNSSYRGGDYYAAPYLSASVVVQRNEDGDEPAEAGWPGPTVVYVMAAEDAPAVERALAGLALLSCRPWS